MRRSTKSAVFQSCSAVVERIEQRVLLSAIAPDPTFGAGGIVLDQETPVGVGIATAYDPATLGVVEAGSPSVSIDANAPILLQRYSSTGAIDTTFGTNGTASDPSATGEPVQVAVLSDGSILVTAVHLVYSSSPGGETTTYYNILAKFTPSGVLDTTFGSSGVVQLNTSAFTPYFLENFLVLSNGEIVLPGQDAANDAALEELTTGGAADMTFGSGGIADGGVLGNFGAVTVDTNGNLIAGGLTATSTPDGLLQRFSSGGVVDSSFNSTGFAEVSNVVQFSAVAVLSSGEIEAFGPIDNGGGFQEFLNDFTSAGAADTTFGGGTGYVQISTTILPAQTQSLFQSNGELLLAGEIPTTPGNSVPGLALVNTSGSLDTSFGTGGYAEFGTGYSSEPGAGGMSLTPSGEILLGNSTADDDVPTTGMDFDPTLMTASGTPDATFGVDGTAVGRPLFENAQTVAELSNGQSLVAGQVTVGGIFGIYVRRYNADGSVDNTFGAGNGYNGQSGYAFVGPAQQISYAPGKAAAVQIAVDSSGRILVGESTVGIIRLSANGALDTTFGTGGTAAITNVDNFILDGSQRILVASGGNMLSRLTSAGLPDSTFTSVALPVSYGSDEGTYYAGPQSYGPIALQSNGMILVGGQGQATITDPDYQGGTATNYDMAVTRVTTSGAVDTSFGNDGVATADFTLLDTQRDPGALDASDTTALAVLTNGDIVAGGFTQQEGANYGPYTAAGAEFLPNGKLNTAFGDGGLLQPIFPISSPTELSASVTNVLVLPDSELVFTGAVSNNDLNPNGGAQTMFYVIGFSSSGTATFETTTQLSPNEVLADADGPFDSLLDATLTSSGGLLAVGDCSEQFGGVGIGLAQYTFTLNFTNTVSGTVFNDLNGDAIQESGETGLAGRTVYDDLNNNGQLDAGEPSTLTDSNGNYTLSDLPSGAGIVRQVMPSGWRQSFPAQVMGEHVTVGSTPVTGANFGATTSIYISGTVFNDVNKNGKQDTSETGLAGWTVYIDLNNSGKPTSNDPSTTTDSAGGYHFAGLAAGTYIVRVIPPSGWTQTYPTNNYGQHITLASGGVNTAVPFGFAMSGGSITGAIDVGTKGVSGVTVYLDSNNNSKLDSGEVSTVTNSSGSYTFSNVPAGAYIVRQILLAGYQQITPIDNYGNHINVTVGKTTASVNFSDKLIPTAAISGEVFNDANGDEKLDNGETGLSGWTVYIDLNNSGAFVSGDPTTTTNSLGDYSFGSLAAGTYIIRVIRPAGWSQTYPTNSYGQHITVANGQTVANVLFGEKMT